MNWHTCGPQAVATWRDDTGKWWLGEWHDYLGPTFFRYEDDGGVPFDEVPMEILAHYEKWALNVLGKDIKLI